jgi:cobalt/nickel transport system ATP-binding protein
MLDATLLRRGGSISVFDLKDVHFSYEGIEALKDFNLTIGEEGSIILGANGSGKSTLLALLDCLLFPQAGSIRFLGQEVAESSFSDKVFSRDFRKRVGFMFQNPDVQLFSATVNDEVAFGPLQLGLDYEDVRERVADTLGMVGIQHLKDRSPHTLSGGEKKKVALASILSVNPQVLLLDEPTGNLDPRTTAWLQDLLCELAREGKIIIMATHDLTLAENVGRHGVVIGEDHRLATQGRIADILSDRALLSEANLIHEHIHSHGGSVHAHGHGHFADHEHEHPDVEYRNVPLEELKSHITECLQHSREMRFLAQSAREKGIMKDIAQMERVLERMAGKGKPRNKK